MKNRTTRVAALLLALTLITSCFVGGTFAKYTSTATGSDEGTVAKWSFKVGETEIASAETQTVTFGLFDTINDTDNTADETDVADGKIAPGTCGSFVLSVENASEVTAKYSITLTATNTSSIPIQYSLDGTNWTTNIDEVKVTDAQLAINAAAATTTVYWMWAYEGTESSSQTDTSDTALGIAAQTTAPTITVTATVTATQID